ncbi:MAG: fibronectin type III domain-containing protein [bacterium]|nr:fibronectin type III domain-containing protein [bacterium]
MIASPIAAQHDTPSDDQNDQNNKPPTVQTLGPVPNENITSTSASVDGIVWIHSPTGEYWFEYWSTDSGGFYQATPTIRTFVDPIHVHYEIVGLEPDTQYTFRIAARNQFGTTQDSASISFKTKSADATNDGQQESVGDKTAEQEERSVDTSQNDDKASADEDEQNAEEAIAEAPAIKTRSASLNDNATLSDKEWWQKFLATRPSEQAIFDIASGANVKPSYRHFATEELMRRDHNRQFLWPLMFYGMASDKDKVAEKFLDFTDLTPSELAIVIKNVSSQKIKARAWEQLVKIPATHQELVGINEYIRDQEPYASLLAERIQRTPSTKPPLRVPPPPPKPTNEKTIILRRILNSQ